MFKKKKKTILAKPPCLFFFVIYVNAVRTTSVQVPIPIPVNSSTSKIWTNVFIWMAVGLLVGIKQMSMQCHTSVQINISENCWCWCQMCYSAELFSFLFLRMSFEVSFLHITKCLCGFNRHGHFNFFFNLKNQNIKCSSWCLQLFIGPHWFQVNLCWL